MSKTITHPHIKPFVPNQTSSVWHNRAVKGFLWFLLGVLGAVAVGLSVHAVAEALNPNPCRFRTLSALAMPLLIGPGGIFLITRSIRLQDGRVPLGMGVVLASLIVLFVGLRVIGELKVQGCAPATLKTNAAPATPPTSTPPGVPFPSLERR